MSNENRPAQPNSDHDTSEASRQDGPVKRADARTGSSGGGPYPLAEPDREEAEQS